MSDKTLDVKKESEKVLAKLAKEGKIPEIRPLTRKERKQLNKDKKNMFISTHDVNDQRGPLEVQTDTVDYVLDNFFKDTDWDDLPNNVCFAFATSVLAATFKDYVAEKN